MSFFVYILYSLSLDEYYVGHTGDLADRLFRHNNSGSKSTKKASDWKIVYQEAFETKGGAVKREMEIKKKKSKKYIEWLVSTAID
jgi:putative endonuclease